MMTRNDFELLANALKSERASIESAGYPKDICEARLQGFSYAVNCVAGVCKANNARFNRGQFFSACGLQS